MTKEQDTSVKLVPLTETTSNQTVTPILNGKVQPECTFEEYVRNLPNSNTKTWSRI